MLWRSAPPKIKMRSNAPIPTILALAALFFLPVGSFAKTTHHHARKATAAAESTPAHPARRRLITKAEIRSAHDVQPSRHHSAAKPSIIRVHTQEPTRHHLRRGVRAVASEPQHSKQTASETTPRKATSADFLNAASTAPQVPAAVAIHGTSQPAELNEAPLPPQSAVHKPASTSTSVPVVSVIRPAAQRPQLDSVEAEASTPVILPALYNKRGRLIVPRPLKGSHEILLHQNQVADRDGLHRIQNDDDLIDMRNQKLLVGLPVSNALDVDDRLPVNRRYCRPWTAQFLATLARAHYQHFHTSLQVNSAVRTAEFQQHLMRINGNAAPAEGDTASPHLTGQAIDIAKHGLSLTEIAWLRGYLLPLVQEGKVDVEEEFQQSCFHISVYKKYLPPASTPGRDLASSHHGETAALATAMR
jgi:hypothetical protein